MAYEETIITFLNSLLKNEKMKMEDFQMLSIFIFLRGKGGIRDEKRFH
jgi:hypothetical protein